MKLTRRELLGAMAACVPIVDAQESDDATLSAAALDKVVIAIDIEPAFAFKA